ncbi:MAG: hypothetical protein RLZZ627_18 [Pseudomonadota bacterium]|jgi:hypothetical protein
MRSGSSMVSKLSWLGLLGFVFGLTGCAGWFHAQMPDDGYRLACGQQCLRNGEDCSRFFAVKNEERRLAFEQAKANYWLCMRRYGDQSSSSRVPCLAPGPQPEAYDHCGNDLEQCLSRCPVTLEELPSLRNHPHQEKGESTSPSTSAIAPGTSAVSNGPTPFK